MFMNRWLYRREIVELNQLTAEEERQVVAAVTPLQGKGEAARYLESEVDEAIGRVRRGRPPSPPALFFAEEEDSRMSDEGGFVGNDLATLVREIFEWAKPRLDLVLRGEGGSCLEPRALTPAQAAVVMRLNVQTVMAWCRDGRLTAAKVGRKWLIPQEAVEQHLKKYRLIHGREDRK